MSKRPTYSAVRCKKQHVLTQHENGSRLGKKDTQKEIRVNKYKKLWRAQHETNGDRQQPYEPNVKSASF